MQKKKNILMYVGVAATVGVVSMFAVSAMRNNNNPAPKKLSAIPKPGEVDADGTGDTLRTVSAELMTVKEELKNFKTNNQNLSQDVNDIKRGQQTMIDDVSTKVVSELSKPGGVLAGVKASSTSPTVSTEQANSAANVAANYGKQNNGIAPQTPAGGDIPGGLGFDQNTTQTTIANQNMTTAVNNNLPIPAKENAKKGLIWIEPLGGLNGKSRDAAPASANTGGAGFMPMNKAATPSTDNANQSTTSVTPNDSLLSQTPSTSSLDPATNSGANNSAANTIKIKTGKTKNAMGPYFTIPENSTLLDVVNMSSLIGRVPVNGKVTDPMPFKVLIGKNNIAASGFELPPDIFKMVASGVATGDWNLSCVKGSINSITFIFNDGRVRTVSEHHSNGSGDGNADVTNSGLGWISDAQGTPCVPGTKITNASAYLGGKILLKGFEAAGKGFAAAQTTNTTNVLGGSSSVVTGDQTKFALGQMLAGGTSETTDWLNARMGQSFDAIFLPGNSKLALHITKEIALDKTEDQRRINYGRVNGVGSTAQRTSKKLD